MTLSLDTNVLVDVARGQKDAQQRFKRLLPRNGEMVVSVVVWHELMLGVFLSSDPEQERARVERVLRGLKRIDLDAQDAEAAAALRAGLRRKGQEIGAYDGLIAGQALAKRWTVVTANTREFARVEGLSVVDWTRPEEQ